MDNNIDFHHHLRGYFNFIDKIDWNQLRPCRLWNMKTYHRVFLHHSFLHAALSHQDSIDNVFRFHDQELCPMYEEFYAILKVPCSEPILVPSWWVPYTDTLLNCFKLPSHYRCNLVEGGGLNLYNSLDLCSRIHPVDVSWLPLMIPLLLQVYLCESPAGIYNFSLVLMIEYMLNGASPVNLVLSQMLIYMHSINKGDGSAFGGSRLLLQLWLFDKIAILKAPEICFDPSGFQGRSSLLRDTKTG